MDIIIYPTIQDGQTALDQASIKGHHNVVELLLGAGGNPDLQDKVGKFIPGWKLIGLKFHRIHAGFNGCLQDYVIVCFVSSEWPVCPHAGQWQWSYWRGTTASLQWGQDRHAEQGQTQHQPITISHCIPETTVVETRLIRAFHGSEIDLHWFRDHWHVAIIS